MPTRLFTCALLLILSVGPARGSLTFTTGLTTTHAGNLVQNGSFEFAAPPDGNTYFWANPTAFPYLVPPIWTSSGPNSSAVWGNDGPSPYRLKLSDVLPDGRAAVDFRTATGVTVSQAPTFNPNGQVTFALPPVFSSTAGAPVQLNQTVHTELVPVPTYNLSFWISGEENSTNQGNTGPGIIGLQITNVLPGDPIQWLAVPNVFAYGLSINYEYTFSPLVPTSPVDISFINWGGLDLSAHGMSAFGTQPILDDVIVNAVVPEAGSLWLGIGGVLAIAFFGRRRRAG